MPFGLLDTLARHLPTLLLVTILVFLLIRFIPGDVITLMVSERQSTSALVPMDQELTTETLRHALGLDMPIHVQYGKWVSDVFQGDLGLSLWGRTSIVDQLADKVPISFELGILAMLVAFIVALPIGVYSAIRQYSWSDYLGRTIAVAERQAGEADGAQGRNAVGTGAIRRALLGIMLVTLGMEMLGYTNCSQHQQKCRYGHRSDYRCCLESSHAHD